MINYLNLLDHNFRNILKNNCEEDLDVSSKENLYLDFNSLTKKVTVEKTIIEANILKENKKIGVYKIVLDSNNELIDDFFIIK